MTNIYIYVFLKLFLLLYADDTVIFSEEANHLQHAVHVFEKKNIAKL